jgi:hypothetical protein
MAEIASATERTFRCGHRLPGGGRCAEPIGTGLGSCCPVHKVKTFEQHPLEAPLCRCEHPYGTDGICSRCGRPSPASRPRRSSTEA